MLGLLAEVQRQCKRTLRISIAKAELKPELMSLQLGRVRFCLRDADELKPGYAPHMCISSAAALHVCHDAQMHQCNLC